MVDVGQSSLVWKKSASEIKHGNVCVQVTEKQRSVIPDSNQCQSANVL